MTLAAFLLWGCGSAEGEPAEEAGAAEVTAEESVIEEEKTEKTEKEEESVEEEPAAEEESVADEETATDMPEAQVTTMVADITEFAQYMANLDPKTPHIVIWNESEEYLIDINDGEYYQLKEGDRIFESYSDEIDAVWTTIPQTEGVGLSRAYEIIPDYANFDSPQECIYGIYLKEDPDTPIYITYYLDAPTEP